ncbi:AbrB/MazE/SpoVT family DNA-binding domain-containing protein [candidate division KSB1 bacterium]|nr:AbrB/MazE/SpoVT family DNA-binding domain-containing protein [candidate division KSB1 bacterium]
MHTVIVSSKYQVVIPKEVREKLEIKVGQRLQLLEYQDRIEFIPQRNIKEMRGFLKGIHTNVPRDKDRV